MENENTQQNINPNAEQTQQWLKEELVKLEESSHIGDYPEPLKFEEGKIIYFNVKIGEKFKKWEGEDVVKRIIPVIDEEGNEKVIWLNVKNPLYTEIVKAAVEGRTSFKVLRTGQKKDTRYTVIKE